MFARYVVIAAASVLVATAATAQTHGQLLESAIFAEDTAGDTAAAIRIYQRLLRTPAVAPEIAARARTRLARAQQPGTQTGLPGRIDPLPPPPPQSPGARGGRGGGGTGTGTFAQFFDSSKQVSVIGHVTQVEWSDPHVVIFVVDNEGKSWGFEFAPPRNLERGGWLKDTLQVGEQVRGEGSLARGVGDGCPFIPLPNGCATYPNGAAHVNARQMLKIDANGNATRPGAGVSPGRGAGGPGGGRGAPGGAAQ